MSAAATEGFQAKISSSNDSSLKFTHTSLNVKDPNVSVEFYKRHFGMTLIKHKEFPEFNHQFYWLAVLGKDQKPEDVKLSTETGVLELKHKFGTEKDPNFKISNGNEEPHRGFGHICFTTTDLPAECERLENEGVAFKKRMSDGRQKNIAFALDPDGYWIELVEMGDKSAAQGNKSLIFNHTMIRVKDIKKSLGFYQNVLGMKILDTSEHADAKFTLYFLGYPTSISDRFSREGVLELTHNWGSEEDPNVRYHTGNDDPVGYSHICISSKEVATLCAEIEKTYPSLQWKAKYNQGPFPNIGFLKDPDGYVIELIPQDIEF